MRLSAGSAHVNVLVHWNFRFWLLFWSTGGPCMHCAGKDAVASGKHSLAAKLAASPVWLSLTLDAETFPSTGQQVHATCVPLPLVIACLGIPFV